MKKSDRSSNKENHVWKQSANYLLRAREYDEIEAVIASAESELGIVRKQINTAGSNFELLQELTKQEQELSTKLDTLMERWAYLEEIAQGS